MKYEMGTNGNAVSGKVLYDATNLVGKVNGLPDGLKVHPSGYVFATGPGGLWIFSPEDEVVAKIHIPQATANCAFDDTYSHIYIAADSTIIQVTLNAASEKK
jgi:gluconolactonase